MVQSKAQVLLRRIFGPSIVELNKVGIVFIMVTVFQTLAVVAGAIANIVLNSQLAQPSISSYFLSGVVIIIIFSMLYFACDSVLNENSFELLGFSVASIVMFVRLIYGIVEEYNRLQVVITSSIVLACQVAQFILIIPLYRSFGWRSYRLIGTDESLITRYQIYCFFIALTKIDILLALLVLLMGVFFVQFDWWYSYLGFGIGMAITLVSAPVCVLGVRRESLIIVALWLVWAISMPAYLVYKIIIFWVSGKVKDWHGTTLKDIDLKIMLTLLAASAIITRVVLWITVVIVAFNFGKGLTTVYQRASSAEEQSLVANNVTEQVYTVTDTGEIVFNTDQPV
jgi:hypothetical protein